MDDTGTENYPVTDYERAATALAIAVEDWLIREEPSPGAHRAAIDHAWNAFAHQEIVLLNARRNDLGD